MKVLVCGGRDFDRRQYLFDTLDALHAECPITMIIEGGQRSYAEGWHKPTHGADFFANEWAVHRNIACYTFRAEWEIYGRAAGPQRNAEMLARGKPDAVCAFPGGAGTADMVRKAKAAGVPIIDYRDTK